jgi:hypothetical protein
LNIRSRAQFSVGIWLVPALAFGTTMGGCFGPAPNTRSFETDSSSKAGQSGNIGETSGFSNAGSTNNNGNNGNSGNSGNAGQTSGTNGQSGMAGTMGEAGTVGMAGTAGMIGIAGMAGSPNPGGMAGSIGTAGNPLGTCPALGIEVENGCDPTLLQDPQNCCVSGRSCQGGSCLDGVCQPVVLVSGSVQSQAITNSLGIACNDSHLIWGTGDGNQVVRVTKDGSVQPSIVLDQISNDYILIDGDEFYFTARYDGRVYSAKVNGGSGFTKLADIPMVEPFNARFSKRGNWLYVPLLAGPDSGLFQISTDPNNLKTNRIGDISHAFASVVDDNYLYWTDLDTKRVNRATVNDQGEVGPIETFAQFTTLERGPMKQDSENLYLASDYTLYQIPKDKSPRVLLKDLTEVISDILVDDNYIYWSTWEGTLQRLPKKGGKSTLYTMGDGPYQYNYMAQDCNTIYITGKYKDPNVGGPYLLKIAKLFPTYFRDAHGGSCFLARHWPPPLRFAYLP